MLDCLSHWANDRNWPAVAIVLCIWPAPTDQKEPLDFLQRGRSTWSQAADPQFLDEATSQLDVGNESRIGEAIAALDITRIMIAHRPQTIAIADRIVRLGHGKFVDVTAAMGTGQRYLGEAEKSLRPV
jgi:hypothetical protein